MNSHQTAVSKTGSMIRFESIAGKGREILETGNAPPNSNKRRQTSIQSFFGAMGGTPKVVSFQNCAVVPSKGTAIFPMTPPTPISPHTPKTPPAAHVAPSAGTPPTDVAMMASDEIHPLCKKIKIVQPARISDVTVDAPQDTTSSRPSSIISVKDKRPKQQTYLDLGQENFAKQTICSTCGMLHVHGLAEDAKEHAKICQDYLKGVAFNTSQARVVFRDKLGSIVEIRPSDSASLRGKVNRVKTIVDHDLGFSPSDCQTQRTAYLYVAKGRIVGMATAEIIDSAFLLESSSLSRSTQSRKALAGIHQLWVHSSFRQQGVATRLVDAMRNKLVFGLVVPPELVAFSSPTEAGASFARQYARSNQVEAEHVLVYDCH